MKRDATTAFARALVDEWARAGTRHAVVAPGSRSAPLALALADDPRLRLHVHLDERSAGFFALGIGKATGQAVPVLCTSGTAAANLHPAVLEAFHGRVPLIVCTADRPPELHDTGAGQTIDQHRLFGTAVRWFADPGAPEDRPGAGAYWRALAARALVEALGPPAGPAHLNLAFREPLVPTGEPLVDAPGRPGGAPWIDARHTGSAPGDAEVGRLAAAVRNAKRGVLVAGWGAAAGPSTVDAFARAAGWPLLADSVSGLRTGAQAIAAYDALLRVQSFADHHRPDLVIRIGAPLTSKAAAGWLDDRARVIVLDPDRAWLDPRHSASDLLDTDPEVTLAGVARALGADPPPSSWLDDWRCADAIARDALDAACDADDRLFEGRVARDLVGMLPEAATLVVASSMPVRDLESFAPARPGIRVLANRGVNGIDGFVSNALGVAAARQAGDPPVVALLGDLCFLHDINGLLGAARRGLDATLVVVDNDGGGIFSFLPYAEMPEHFETLFGTPPGADLGTVAGAYGVPHVRVERASDLVGAVDDAVDAGGVRVVLVPTDRADNVRRHHAAFAAVTGALDGAGRGGRV